MLSLRQLLDDLRECRDPEAQMILRVQVAGLLRGSVGITLGGKPEPLDTRKMHGPDRLSS